MPIIPRVLLRTLMTIAFVLVVSVNFRLVRSPLLSTRSMVPCVTLRPRCIMSITLLAVRSACEVSRCILLVIMVNLCFRLFVCVVLTVVPSVSKPARLVTLSTAPMTPLTIRDRLPSVLTFLLVARTRPVKLCTMSIVRAIIVALCRVSSLARTDASQVTPVVLVMVRLRPIRLATIAVNPIIPQSPPPVLIIGPQDVLSYIMWLRSLICPK